MFGAYPRRTVVGLSLFIGQAFLYNAVFFTYALVLGTFYDVKPDAVGYYIIPFAIGNFLGPLVLGRLFDSVGRKPMIAGTYIVSGVLLIVTAFLFRAGVWSAETQTAAWCVIFFFASAGASSAYLTVSEIFPMETRALAIAFFYAIGTAAGGITGPLLFGKLVATEDAGQVFWGYVLGAALMIAAGIVQALIGVEAAQKDLEEVAKPLSAEAAEGAEGAEAARPSATTTRPAASAVRAASSSRASSARAAPSAGAASARSEARALVLARPAVLLAGARRGRRRRGRRRSSPRCARPAPRASTAARSATACAAGAGGRGGSATRCPSPSSAGWSGPPRAAATSPGRRSAAAAEPARGAAWRGPATRRNLESDQCPSAERTALGGPWVQRNQLVPKKETPECDFDPTSPSSPSSSVCSPRRWAAPRRPPRVRHVEGRVLSVDRSASTFKLRDSERGTFTIRVTSATKFERVRFSTLKRRPHRRGDHPPRRRPLAGDQGRAELGQPRRRDRRRQRPAAAATTTAPATGRPRRQDPPTHRGPALTGGPGVVPALQTSMPTSSSHSRTTSGGWPSNSARAASSSSATGSSSTSSRR